MNRSFRCIASVAVFLFLVAAAGQANATGPAAASYARDIQPILAKRCFACHGPDDAESGLALHERESALMAIEPGAPEKSELLRRVMLPDDGTGERMPPEGDALSSREVKLLRQWVKQGAAYEKHWAFVPPQQSDPPKVKDPAWVANPIDAFVLQGLEAAGLTPAEPADKRTLARRVYYDITGLPPTTEQLRRFLEDDRPGAYERLIDKLLASPRYGEKWARHWLDVVRYAETNSFERDNPKPNVWKYRDYVIRSLNDDKPYDQFVREQLAGDELDEVTIDSITATGYYRLGTWDDEPADRLQAKYDDLDNIVSTTGQAFLGLTIGCARCHDHKIDPVPQTDYYSLLAFFADVTPYGSRGDRQSNNQWNVSEVHSTKAQATERRKLLRRQKQLGNAKLNIERDAIVKMEGVDQRRTETEERQAVLDEKLHLYTTKQNFRRYEELIAELATIQEALDALPEAEMVLSLAKCTPQPGTTHVMLRGNANVLGDPVEPCFPELFGDDPPRITDAPPGARSAGRRRVLADWITRPDNLLSNRVIANRVWQHHFGRGIVRSANNFGQLGTPPTHPELLDWLALWLVDNDWRLKPLHRLILTSNTYKMSSRANKAGLAADAANDRFWRFDMRRLTAEELRDTVLFVSGRLNEQMYGPSIYPKLSKEVLATQSRPGANWHTSKPVEASRRSIYIHIKRSLIPPSLSAFDFPDTDTSCEARFNTTQAAQALNLLHSEFMQKQSAHLADRAAQEAGADARAQINRVLRLALQREPDEATVADALALMNRYQSQHGLDESEALRQCCLMVMNLNEFVYLD
ncbi:MAG: PSD1 and planctomycete cytochrome C domain-containing protein [Planctomycetota bacterium]